MIDCDERRSRDLFDNSDYDNETSVSVSLTYVCCTNKSLTKAQFPEANEFSAFINFFSIRVNIPNTSRSDELGSSTNRLHRFLESVFLGILGQRI